MIQEKIQKKAEKEITCLGKQVYFPKFTFDDILALQCCMETVKKVQEDKKLYEQLNLIHSKMYDAYWFEKQGDALQTNERTWLYLISDVLTWKDGIGQYLDDTSVQKLAKKLCNKYAQKLYNHSVLSNSSNTGKNEKNSADKIEPRFKVGDWVVNKFGDSWHIDSLDKKNYQVSDGKGNYNYFPISKQDEMHYWNIQDAKDGNVLATSAGAFIYNGNNG